MKRDYPKVEYPKYSEADLEVWKEFVKMIANKTFPDHIDRYICIEDAIANVAYLADCFMDARAKRK